MKVILNKDVQNLGEEGDVKDVANGFARNYLIPRNLVLLYNKSNLQQLESRKASIEKAKEEKRKSALDLKERLESEEYEIAMPAGGNGKLFGSVTNANVFELLEKKGIPVERKKIEVPDHMIKTLGVYTIKVKLYNSQEAKIKLNVKKEEK